MENKYICDDQNDCYMTTHGINSCSKWPHILIASDKFKGGLSSEAVAEAIKTGILTSRPGMAAFCTIVGMADGGDGSAKIFQAFSGAEKIECSLTGPLGNKVVSFFMYSRDKKCAFVEMAKVSGLEMVPPEKRNPLYTTSFGMGEILMKAYEAGAEEIVIGIGGSATSDCGCGMLEALGISFLDKSGRELHRMTGGKLKTIGSIIVPDSFLKTFLTNRIKVTVICDVENPLCGANGAAFSFAAQKGADAEAVKELDEGAENFIRAIKKSGCREGFSPTVLSPKAAAESKGAGAAGGIGFAFLYFLGAEMESGFNYFSRLQNLKEKMKEADIVISGEGMIDKESLRGKVIGGILRLVREVENEGVAKKQILLFCGVNKCGKLSDADGRGIKVYAMSDIEPDLSRRIKGEKELLRKLSAKSINCTIME